MKMISRTSRTSISGVTFISALARSPFDLATGPGSSCLRIAATAFLPWRSTQKKRRGSPRRSQSMCSGRLVAGRPGPHFLGDDADLLHAGALGRVDHRDDVGVPQRAGGSDEHRLFLTHFKNAAEFAFEVGQRDGLLVDGDLTVRGVLQHDLLARF